MSDFRKTLETYKSGSKAMAYLAFKNDPNSNSDTSFDVFCKGMDAVIGNVHSISPSGKKEIA